MTWRVEITPSFSTDYLDQHEYVKERMPLDVFIDAHNERAKNPNPTTGLPKPWDEESEERKQRLLESCFYYYPYSPLPRRAVHRPNGCFIKFFENEKLKWVRLASKTISELLK